MALLKRSDGTDKVTTIIGPGTRLEGTLTAKSSIRVDGEIQGKVITPGEVYIGEEGRVEADVEAGSLIVAGLLAGSTEVKGRFEIKQGGTLRGDLRADKVVMEEGSVFEGRCSMSREEGEKSKKDKDQPSV